MAIEVNDMFYAYSKDEEIKEKGEYGGAVTTIMKKLLEEGIVDAVVAVEEGWDLYDAVPILITCLLYTSPSPRDKRQSRMPSSA